tara:strand:- start:687 stop:1232 length:546 start_codon:yes stop_codon:yes gene_type:complete
MATTEIATQFTGLPIENLIAAPLLAAAEGQKSLAQTTTQFIEEVGLDKDGKAKSVTFSYQDGDEVVALNAPLLSIVNVPSLLVDTIDINFQMEVTTQEGSKSSTDASAEVDASVGFACWKASFKGKVSHHSESNRSTDTSAKYNVAVKGKQEKPEGLNKILDLLSNSIGKKGDAKGEKQGN